MNIVVGAGSGMGEAASIALVDRGELLVADKNGDAVSDLAGRLGENVQAMACDITVEADLAALVQRVDHLDVLVIAAGLSPSFPVTRVVYEVNLVGMARLLDMFDPMVTHGTVVVLFASNGGYMVKITPEMQSVLDEPLVPDFLDRLAGVGVDIEDSTIAYLLTKAAVQRLARKLATVWGPRGARVVSVSPGMIDTPMAQQLLQSPEWGSSSQERVRYAPLGRLGRADEVASAVAFLTSSAASFVTGCDLIIDGGALAKDEFLNVLPLPTS